MEKNKNISYWIDSVQIPDYPRLEKDMRTDTAVIGGGIVGITCAYLLKNQGIDVTLIESNKIARGTSGHTTGKLTSQHILMYYKLIKRTSLNFARLYAQANENAINFVEQTVNKLGISCDFKRTPAYVVTHREKYVKKIKNEAEAAKRLGLDAKYMEKVSLSPDIKAALRFNNQAQFHPRKYLAALAEEINKGGNVIYENTKAVDIIKDNGYIIVTQTGQKIRAKRIIIATHYPIKDKKGLFFTRLYPERSYISAFTINGDYHEGMYITAEKEGYSLRSQPLEGGEMVLIAGGDHRAGCGNLLYTKYIELKDLAKKLYDVKDFLYQWSAEDFSTPLKVPYAGEVSVLMPCVYTASGFDKWGMADGTASALIICDLITKGRSIYGEIYSPCRMPVSLASIFRFLGKNIATLYYLIFDRIKRYYRKCEIKNGEARLIWYKGKRSGAYRDEEGNLHIVSTLCPHMKCRLNFNDAEKTWDCPCHGSRFDIDGNVLNTPATTALPHETSNIK